MKSVVVSGAQALSSAGIGRESLVQAIRLGRLCASTANYTLPIEQVARIEEPIPQRGDFPDDRKCWLGFAAAELAWKESGLKEVNGARVGVFVGTGLSSITAQEVEEDLVPHLVDGRFDRRSMGADLRQDKAAPRRHLPHRLCLSLAQHFCATGPTGTNFSACAAAAQAIAAGMKAIRRGEIDVALVGGHDSMDHPMGVLSFVVLGALSSNRCRPFDVHRNGFMLGEGAAFLVLESEEHLRRRGATAIATVCGAGTSIDAWNATAPHPQGLGAERAMRRALKDAGLAPSDIDYINAHGTGTPLGDIAEAQAINRVFGATVPVSSIKGAIGHCIAAAGAIEAVACIGAMEVGFLPGTVGLENPDPACDIWALSNSIQQPVEYLISNSFGFGGQNCALVLGRFT